MKKRFLVKAIGLGLVFTVAFGIYFMKAEAEVKIVYVDEIARAPDRFRGYIGVIGEVIKIDVSQAIFVLGCLDSCIRIPVRYKGQMPKLRSKITVFGEIKEEKGRYIFEAKEFKAI